MISIVEDKNLLDFCNVAYDSCVRWFGTPQDEDWPTELFRMNNARCYRIQRSKKYIITTCSHYTTINQDKATIAHEMFHRVTALYPEMKINLWIDEMLAYLTSRQILIEIGLGSYSNYRDSIILQSNQKLDINTLKNYRKSKTIFFSKKQKASFYNSTSVLGIELMYHLEWEHICNLVPSKSLDQWLLSLPINKQQIARKLLDI